MFRRSIHRYRLRVIRVQRMVRGYITCSKARMQLLERLWTTVEAGVRREAAKDVVKCRRLNSHVSHLQKLAKSDPFVQALRRASAAVQASQQYVTTAADVSGPELRGQGCRRPTGALAAPEKADIGGSRGAGAGAATAKCRRASIAEEIPVSRQKLAILPPGKQSTPRARASGARRETTRQPAVTAAATKRRSSFSGVLQGHQGVGGVAQPSHEDVASLPFARRPSAADSTLQDLLDRSQVSHCIVHLHI